MKRTSPTPADTRRPLLVRAAHKWYAWSGVALTFVGAYLTATGQVRVGDAQLRAAPPQASSTSWKPAEGQKLTVAPVPATDDPFKPAAVPETKPETVAIGPSLPAAVPSTTSTKPPPTPLPDKVVGPALAGPALPDPFTASKDTTKPLQGTRTGAILEAYVDGSTPKVPAPAGPVIPVRVDIPAVKPVISGSTGPKVEVALPLPVAVPPIAPPAAAPAVGPALARPVANVALPPIPAPPAPFVLQEPEPLLVAPKPVEKLVPAPAATPKKEAPIRKRKLVGTLPPEDDIKLNAAQNAARLKDWNRAAALLNEIIAKHPNEYDLRAELAGWLIAAGDYRRAIPELETTIRQNPNSVGYRILLGDALMGLRNFRGASAVYWSAVEMAQNDPALADRFAEIVIRAARSAALDNDLFRAAGIVDKYLAGVRPDDETAPLALGALLLDLDRPYDALPYLIEKRKQLLRSPEQTEEYELRVLEVLASMVRGFARVGERAQALEAIQEMSTKVPAQTGIRIALADILFEINEHDLAGHVYNQVLATDPANGAALIGIARVYLETYQPAAAKRVLDSFVPNAEHQRGYLMTYSSYHQTVGEYTEAKQIYKDMLRRNENDHEVRYALGRVYEYTKEWEKGKAEFAKIPPQDKLARRARYWFGMALLHQRKFGEAVSVAEQFMRDDPTNPEGISLYVRALAKTGAFDKAIQAGRGYLMQHQRDDRRTTAARLAVARALLEANRNLEAAREYELVLSRPAGRVPEAYYGLARAAEKLGNGDRAQQILGTICGTAGIDVRSRLMLADYYSEDYEDQKVIEIAGPLMASEPNNLAVLIRLADAQQRAARWPGNPADCFATCQTILRQSPTNVRGHLAMARSFAITQNYRKSAVQYDQLIAIDPDFTIPPRERARVLYSDHQYSAARSQYNVVLSPSPEDVVAGQMSYYAHRDPKLRQAFGPYMNGHMSGAGLRAELARMATSAGDEEIRLAAHRLVCDYDATLAWQEAFRLERDGKELKDYRNYMAIPQYNAANQFEPTNTETLFDEGQTYGALKMTRAALTWYSNCLAVDPTHRESIAASERASAEISPKLDLKYDYFHQRGRGGLASIDRQRMIAAGSVSLGDENEYLQAGYMVQQFMPLDDAHLWGNVPFLRVQKKWDDNRLMTWGQVNLEQYRERFSTRPTFDAGAWYDHNDVLRTYVGAFLENVAENGESIRQDIYRYGGYLGADLKPTRVWQFGGRYTYAAYSDDNDMHQAYLYNQVALTLPPKLLQLVQKVNLWGYRDQTRFPNERAEVQPGTIHPYFAPDVFASWELRVEWWHWLSRDFFVHSNQCYYSLQYGFTLDDVMTSYHDFKFLVNYDFNSWASVGGEARAMVSSGNAYNVYQAMAFLQFRFGP